MNKNDKVIEDFGNEWTLYDYKKLDQKKLYENFQQYFSIFPWDLIGTESTGFDMGCGTGRWAKFVAPKVKNLNCIEPSKAIEVAKKNLKEYKNINYFNETTESCSLENNSQNFGYCLGVLHHIPDTQKAIFDCSKFLIKGSPFLLYLYYNFENKPLWFRGIWIISDLIRRAISKLPGFLKIPICEIIAVLVYLPLTKISFLLEKFGMNVENIPLSDYRTKPYYQLRNDSLDRFGTRIEKRFSKKQIKTMLENSGFEKVTFSKNTPYWCCLAYKA